MRKTLVFITVVALIISVLGTGVAVYVEVNAPEPANTSSGS